MTSVVLNPELDAISRLIVLGAMTLYAIAFVMFSVSLARAANAGKDKTQIARAALFERIALIITVVSVVAHGAGVLTRGIAAARVPWANMYEFSVTGSFVVMSIYLLSLIFRPIKYLAAFVTGFVVLILGSATTLFYVEVKSLMPALQNNWLLIHVTVAILATAFFMIGAALAFIYLMREWEWFNKTKSPLVVSARKVLAIMPKSDKLERQSYQFNIIGLILWTFTLIAGAIWADKAWHRFWGWDTKEVWTFIIWCIYMGYGHATVTRGWDGKRAAWLSMIGFVAILFNFTIVNLYFKGLHVYSGL